MQQSVGLEHGVGVGDEQQRIAGHGHGGVDGIGAAAVFLGHHHEVGVVFRFIDGPDFFGLDAFGAVPVDAAQVEVVDEHLEGVIRRAVIDDDDLMCGIVEVQEVLRGVDDDGRLVVRRHDNGDRHGEVGFGDAIELGEGDAASVAADLDRSEQDQQQVDAVQNDKVDEDKGKQDVDDGHHVVVAVAGAPCSPRTWRLISRA